MNNTDKQHTQKVPNKRKILLRVIIIIFALIALMYLMLIVFEKIADNDNVESQTFETYSDFESANYNYNIFEDAEYSEILSSEFIKFYDEYTNITVGVKDVQDAYSNGYDAGFLTEYIYSIIEGDSEKYNAFFSSEYYKTNEPKEKFTMQKICDVLITRKIPADDTYSSEDYNVYYCALEYRILDNNGTFRKDIKEGYKTQYIVITDREGKLLIDSIY